MTYSASVEHCQYLPDTLTIFVVGASGDLAKKKTYPSLFDLFRHGFLLSPALGEEVLQTLENPDYQSAYSSLVQHVA